MQSCMIVACIQVANPFSIISLKIWTMKCFCLSILFSSFLFYCLSGSSPRYSSNDRSTSTCQRHFSSRSNFENLLTRMGSSSIMDSMVLKSATWFEYFTKSWMVREYGFWIEDVMVIKQGWLCLLSLFNGSFIDLSSFVLVFQSWCLVLYFF